MSEPELRFTGLDLAEEVAAPLQAVLPRMAERTVTAIIIPKMTSEAKSPTTIDTWTALPASRSESGYPSSVGIPRTKIRIVGETTTVVPRM